MEKVEKMSPDSIHITAEVYAIRYVQIHCDLKNMSVVEFAQEVIKVAGALEEMFRKEE